MIAPRPADEEARLQTLAEYGLLDTAADPSFDRLTALAARLFRVPVVLISLVDRHRQWFKSHHGWERCETSRDVSFCAHTILLSGPEEVLLVPDATRDPRFADNPLVIGEPHLRFYAGAPLRATGGQALGSLCLVDMVPRPDFSADDAAALSHLAATASEVLELHLARTRCEREAAERRAAEEALQARETQFRLMTANAPGMIYQLVLPREGTFHFPFVSEGCREFFGVEPKAICENPALVLEKLEPAEQETLLTTLAESASTLEPWRWEGGFRALDGTWRRAQAVSRPERMTEGGTLWNGVLVDVTDRRRAEGRVLTVLESITDAFYSLDLQWRFTYVNEQAQRVLERPRAELLGRSFWEVFPYKAKMAYHPQFHEALRTGQPANFELYSTPLRKWLGVHAYPSEEGLSVYVQDITERRRAQQALEENLGLLRAIIDGTDNHIFIKDLQSRYLLMNPAAAALLGTTPLEAIGRDDETLFPPESARRNRAADLEVMRTGQMLTCECSDTLHGVEHVFLTTKCPYRDATGKLLGVIGIARDITAQRRAAEALREAKEEAEKANHAKSEFLSRMSHELRTPLNAILGFGQLLELTGLAEGQVESVNHILKAGRHLLSLIDEVLAISRIEAGRMRLSLEPVAVDDVVEECLQLVGRQAAERRVQFRSRGHRKFCHVQADRQRLRQVLLNLFSNAIKYNREGGRVTLTWHEVPGPGPAGEARPEGAPPHLRLEVADTGPGLSAGEMERLFTPFERLRADRTAVEGVGLGLALSRSLVETMSGRIGVRSRPGEGSTFWLELPVASDPRERVEREAFTGHEVAEEACHGCVLYIEDNLSNLRLLEMLLRDWPGLDLLSAQQGTLGLELARARRPDLILLDLHLPDLPGWEVLEQLQGDPATADIPVIVVSADATPHRVERLLQAGAREFLTKPLDVRALLKTMGEYLHLAEAPVATP